MQAYKSLQQQYQKLKLRQEELAALEKGAQLVKGRIMTAFLSMGLKLEDAQ